ncbi:MAG: DinB family protein [Armatimonadetes bacterium]|nr:DinB family protein [Armatimonadota bacterium]
MESLIASCKESAVRGMEIFLKTFSFVPDEKLNWTPSPTAKSAIRIAAHTALYAGTFAKMIRDRKLPTDDIPAFVARLNAAEEAVARRAEMESLFRQNTDEVIAALDTLSPEAIGTTLDTSLGWSMPMTFLMNLPGMHAMSHAAQIDYLQTCWGDQDVHF